MDMDWRLEGDRRRISLVRFFPFGFSEAHAHAAAVLIDEPHA